MRRNSIKTASTKSIHSKQTRELNNKVLSKQHIHQDKDGTLKACTCTSVSYTHLRAHETDSYLVCRLLLEKKQNKEITSW